MSPSHRLPSGPEPLDVAWICRSVLQATYPQFRGVPIAASFYPYIGLTHTIRKRGSGWVIRISDHCRTAPRIVIEAIALILGAKILRRRPPRDMLRVYDRFRNEPVVEEMLRSRRGREGRKVLTPKGRHHSLPEIYAEVNRSCFNGQVDIREIGWSARRSWGRLGHYDPVHNTVTISPVLDSPRVPRSVVAYIVYHELLHTLFEYRTNKGTRRYHPPEFRKAEKSHPDYDFATRFLREYCHSKGKRRSPHA